MPDEDNDFDGYLVFDFRKWWTSRATQAYLSDRKS